MSMRIGFVGGGTGGHFYPLIATAQALRNGSENPELYYFGPSPYSNDDLKRHNINYIYCPAGKLRRYFSVQNFFDVFRTFFGFFIAIWKLYVIYPDVIFSKGGYTSVPILLAARFLRIPVVIHESDAVPGRANKLVIKQARYIGIAYDEVAKYFPTEKTALVGIPIRTELLTEVADPHMTLGIPKDKPLIYVTGGSSGAERLNNILLRTLNELLPHYRIFHQVGGDSVDTVKLAAQGIVSDESLKGSYYIEGSIGVEMVKNIMKASSIVITRAGSTTLFEIAYFGKPSIVIPIPEDISHDQRTNAYAYAKSGAATVLEEHNLTPNLFIQEIHSIISNQEKYNTMAKAAKEMYIGGASEKIANILISIGAEHGSK